MSSHTIEISDRPCANRMGIQTANGSSIEILKNGAPSPKVGGNVLEALHGKWCVPSSLSSLLAGAAILGISVGTSAMPFTWNYSYGIGKATSQIAPFEFRKRKITLAQARSMALNSMRVAEERRHFSVDQERKMMVMLEST